MALEAFSAQSEYYKSKVQQNHAQGSQGMAMLNGLLGMSGSASMDYFRGDVIHDRQKAFYRMLNGDTSSTGALRDGTGKEVSHPKSFIEELQAETERDG